MHFKILQLSKAKLLAIVTNGVASVAPWAKTAQETNISIDLRQIFTFAKITVLSSQKLQAIVAFSILALASGVELQQIRCYGVQGAKANTTLRLIFAFTKVTSVKTKMLRTVIKVYLPWILSQTGK